MAMEVWFHPFADADLEAIYQFISSDSPDRAIAFVRRIRGFCNTLETMPFRGRDRSDLAGGVRTLVFERRVVVAYRVHESRLTILRLIYAGQNIEDTDWPAD
jgi:toxin ParE1/3/4